MAIKEVIRMGHPTLRKIAEEVSPEEILTAEFKALIEDMYDTMKATQGIGIAAPQINISKQIAIIELPEDNERYQGLEASDLIIIVNPKITVLDDTHQGFWEGCLSVPGLRGHVRRPRKVQIHYLDQNAEAQTIIAENFLATVFQHELDHLFGKLYIDRLSDPTKLSYESEYREFLEEN